MSKLNGQGPENKGSKTGRGLGECYSNAVQKAGQYKLGEGMGKRRNVGEKVSCLNKVVQAISQCKKGQGMGKRRRAGMMET